MYLPSSQLKIKARKKRTRRGKQAESARYLLQAGFFLGLVFHHERGREGVIYLSHIFLLAFTGPHGVMSENKELFIGTAVRSSNPIHSDRLQRGTVWGLRNGFSWIKIRSSESIRP
jgi:hypothetical protein